MLLLMRLCSVSDGGGGAAASLLCLVDWCWCHCCSLSLSSCSYKEIGAYMLRIDIGSLVVIAFDKAPETQTKSQWQVRLRQGLPSQQAILRAWSQALDL
ncbi:hypothetical protein AB3S75_044660 [Citrus x aurantiifolia]